MSLTSHLRSPESPVRQFMVDRFGHTQRVAVPDPAFIPGTSGSPVLPAAVGEPVVRPATSPGYPWTLVGAAIDYRIRLFMRSTDPDQLVARRGADELEALFGIAPAAFTELSDELRSLVPVGSRTEELLEREAEQELLRDCFVLGMYESCFRAHAQQHWPIVQAGGEASLAELKALCPPAALDDLMALAQLAAERCQQLFSGSQMAMNPNFSSSGLLGGADADFIVDGCLYDIKTTVDKSPGRTGLWQVVGYALADTDDEFGLEHLGFYFSRQGEILRWPLQGLLDALGARHVNLTQERTDFRQMLETLHEERVLALEELHRLL